MLDNLNQRVSWAIKIITEDDDLDRGITDVALAKILGTNKNTLAGYRHEKGLLKGEVIDNLVSHYNFSPMWLFKGEGEPFPGARAKYRDVCETETPDPPKSEHLINEKAAIYATPGAKQAPTGTEIRISDAMTMTARVLESGTSYATALYLNIVHFDRAVSAETTMFKCQEDLHKQGELIAQMQTRLDEMDREAKTLREEIRELKRESGGCPPIALGMDHAARTGTDDQKT
jgi:hypothetical protein